MLLPFRKISFLPGQTAGHGDCARPIIGKRPGSGLENYVGEEPDFRPRNGWQSITVKPVMPQFFSSQQNAFLLKRIN
jgi:hypothetical protein